MGRPEQPAHALPGVLIDEIREYAAYILLEIPDPGGLVFGAARTALCQAKKAQANEKAAQEKASAEALGNFLAAIFTDAAPPESAPASEAVPVPDAEPVPQLELAAPEPAAPEPEPAPIAEQAPEPEAPTAESQTAEPQISVPAEVATPELLSEEGEESGELTANEQQIVEWLRQHPGRHFTREITAGLPNAPKSLSPYLTILVRDGFVERSGEGGTKHPFQHFLPGDTSEQKEAPAAAPLRPHLQRIVEWLTERPGPHICSEIARSLDKAPHNLSGDLGLLVRSGHIQREGVGGVRDPYRFFVGTSTSPEPEKAVPAGAPVTKPAPAALPVKPAAVKPAPEPVPAATHTPEALLDWFRLHAGTHSAQELVDTEGGNRLAVQLQLSALASKGQLRRFGSQAPGDELTFCFPQALTPAVGLPMWATPNAEALETVRREVQGVLDCLARVRFSDRQRPCRTAPIRWHPDRDGVGIPRGGRADRARQPDS